MSHKRNDPLQTRSSLPPDARETLVTCPACAGHKFQFLEYEDGTFDRRPCIWCEGLGCTNHKRVALFERWLRIRKVNRCGSKSKRPPSWL